MSEGNVFEGVSYFLPEKCLKDPSETKRLLREGGGGLREFYATELVTHVVADSQPDPASLHQITEAIVVSSYWVELSVKCGAALPTAPFELSDGKLFSKLVFCTSKLCRSDVEKLCVLVAYHGGKLQRRLDPSVTHLITMETTGAKYESATQHGIRTVSPDWILDCIEEGRRLEVEGYHPSELVLTVPSPTYCHEGRGEEEEEEEEEGKEEVLAKSLNDVPLSEGPCVVKDSDSGRGEVEVVIGGMGGAPDGGKLPGKQREEPMIGQTATEGICEGDESASDREAVEYEQQAVDEVKSNKEVSLLALGTDEERVKLSQTQPLGKDATTFTAKTTPTDTPLPSEAPPPPPLPSPSPPSPTEHGTRPLPQTTSEPQPARQGGEGVPLLEGVVVCFLDYQECMESETISKWKQVVVQHGGKVLEGYDAASCTHLLALHKRSKVFEQACSEGKCVASAHWLNDVLMEQRMFPPRSALHLPTAFKWQLPSAESFSMTLTNYTDAERELVKDLIRITGIPYTGHLSRETTHLICKRAEGMKYAKAVEWGVQVVNASFLSHMIHTATPPSSEHHFTIGSPDEFSPVCCETTAEILEPWKHFLEEYSRLHPDWTAEPAGSAHPGKRERGAEDEGHMTSTPCKKQRSAGAEEGRSTTPVVLFTGIVQSTAKKLKQLVQGLGGRVTDRPRECTHLVAPRLTRTVKFLSGLSVCSHLTSPDWVEASGRAGCFQEEEAFPLRDSEAEASFHMDLAVSVERAHKKKLLMGLVFFATENVQPPYNSLKEIVECAGGELLSLSQLVERYGSNLDEGLAAAGEPSGNQQRLIVISCPKDISSGKCGSFFSNGIGVYNTEFVLTGVLQQELDYSQNQLLDVQ